MRIILALNSPSPLIRTQRLIKPRLRPPVSPLIRKRNSRPQLQLISLSSFFLSTKSALAAALVYRSGRCFAAPADNACQTSSASMQQGSQLAICHEWRTRKNSKHTKNSEYAKTNMQKRSGKSRSVSDCQRTYQNASVSGIVSGIMKETGVFLWGRLHLGN